MKRLNANGVMINFFVIYIYIVRWVFLFKSVEGNISLLHHLFCPSSWLGLWLERPLSFLCPPLKYQHVLQPFCCAPPHLCFFFYHILSSSVAFLSYFLLGKENATISPLPASKLLRHLLLLFLLLPLWCLLSLVSAPDPSIPVAAEFLAPPSYLISPLSRSNIKLLRQSPELLIVRAEQPRSDACTDYQLP